MGRGIITLLTDYGLTDSYVGQVKGVIKSLAPDADILDISHHIPPGDISQGARVLAEAASRFPEGTVHLAVVDPEVGGLRKRLVIRAGQSWFVGPDNGLLFPAVSLVGAERFFEIEKLHLFPLLETSATFDGRNVFAPAAAMLARGGVPEDFCRLLPFSSEVMPIQGLSQKDPIVEASGEIFGEIVAFDHFGNAATNIPAAMVPVDCRAVLLPRSGLVARRVRSFSDLAPGEAGFLFNHQAVLEIVLFGESAQSSLQLALGDRIRTKID